MQVTKRALELGCIRKSIFYLAKYEINTNLKLISRNFVTIISRNSAKLISQLNVAKFRRHSFHGKLFRCCPIWFEALPASSFFCMHPRTCSTFFRLHPRIVLSFLLFNIVRIWPTKLTMFREMLCYFFAKNFDIFLCEISRDKMTISRNTKDFFAKFRIHPNWNKTSVLAYSNLCISCKKTCPLSIVQGRNL
jgi:hypothetical protein